MPGSDLELVGALNALAGTTGLGAAAAANRALSQSTLGTVDADTLRTASGPWIDVTHPDYGAVGDGSTDDTAAIQAAIDAAAALAGSNAESVVEVRLPAKTFVVTQLQMESGVSLVGAGKFATIIQQKANTDDGAGGVKHAIVLADPDTTHRTVIKHLTVDGNKTNQTTSNVGIYYDNGSFSGSGENYDPRHFFFDVQVKKCKGDGVSTLGNARGLRMLQVLSKQNGGYGFKIAAADNRMIACVSDTNDKTGFSIESSAAPFGATECKSFYSGNNDGGNDGHGFNCKGAWQRLVACEAQDNKGHGFQIQAQHDQIMGCLAMSNGRGATDSGTFAGIKVTATADHAHVILTTDDRQGTPEQDYGVEFVSGCQYGFFLITTRRNAVGPVKNIANADNTNEVVVLSDQGSVIRRLGYSSAYTPTNVSTDRAFDADTVLVAELADVVGTLIADLQSAGILA